MCYGNTVNQRKDLKMLELNRACRRYRTTVKATQPDIAHHSGKVTLISAFELGATRNMLHIERYRQHAIRTGNLDTFIKIMTEEISK